MKYCPKAPQGCKLDVLEKLRHSSRSETSQADAPVVQSLQYTCLNTVLQKNLSDSYLSLVEVHLCNSVVNISV
jgi:hypothetical protein